MADPRLRTAEERCADIRRMVKEKGLTASVRRGAFLRLALIDKIARMDMFYMPKD